MQLSFAFDAKPVKAFDGDMQTDPIIWNAPDFDDPSEDNLPNTDSEESPDAEEEIPWQDVYDDLQDYDENAGREAVEVQTDDQIDRETRAWQEAIALGEAFGWTEQDIRTLSTVFFRYGWGPARRSLEREMKLGLTAWELGHAFQLREIWESYPEFGIASGWYSYLTLSWPFALQIVRSFSFEPSCEELELFLVDAFNDWKYKSTRRSGSSYFISYLKSLLDNPYLSDLSSPEVLLEMVTKEDDDAFDSFAVSTGFKMR